LGGYLDGDDSDKLDTVVKCMQYAAKKFKKNECLGHRKIVGKDGKKRGKFDFMNYKKAWDKMQHFGTALNSLRFEKVPEEIKVGIFGSNRPEWMISLMGLWSQGYVGTALYDDQSEKDREHIISHSGMSVLSCEYKNVGTVLKTVKKLLEDGKPMNLVHIVVWSSHDRADKKGLEKLEPQFREVNIRLQKYKDFLGEGQVNAVRTDLTPDSPAFVMYTSGTSGTPKGAEISHGNICASVASFKRYMEDKASGVDLKEPQAHMSYLPLAHAFEQSFQILMLVYGAKIGYWSGNIKLLKEDWKALKPTIICGVPRVYEKTLEKVRSSILASESSIKDGQHKIRSGENKKKSWWDKSLGKILPTRWSAIRYGMGWGKVKVVVSGASPLPAEISEFLEILVGHPVLEGYGMTETFALGTHTVSKSNTKLNVGIPFDNIEIRLKTVKTRGYYVKDVVDIDGTLVSTPQGEIQIRGPSVFKGYYDDSSVLGFGGETSKAFDGEWLRTGDIGRINPNKTLSIIGRANDLMKTGKGEYIDPRKMERHYRFAEEVNQVWVYGNSYCSSIVAVVVPNHIWAGELLKKAKLLDFDKKINEKNCYTEEFAKAFQKAGQGKKQKAQTLLKEHLLEAMRKQEGALKSVERITDIIVEMNINELGQGFTVTNSLITPTNKPRSKAMLEKYREELKQLYGKHGEVTDKW